MAKGNKQQEKVDTEVMTKVYRKLGTPGTQHRLLAGMAESWTTKMSACLEPGKAPVGSTGTSEQKMILGGRFLQQEFTGEMMGGTFSVIGVIDTTIIRNAESTLFSTVIRGDGLGLLRRYACWRRDTAGAGGDHSSHVELEMGHHKSVEEREKAKSLITYLCSREHRQGGSHPNQGQRRFGCNSRK